MAYPAGPVSAILDWYGHTGEGMAVVSQARLAHVAVTQSVQSVEIFFVFIFQLFGWALVAPLHFALHYHCSLVSMTVSQEHFFQTLDVERKCELAERLDLAIDCIH